MILGEVKMIIEIKQGSSNTKKEFLDTIEAFEDLGYKIFDIGCYDEQKCLAEATLIKDEENNKN